MSLFACPGGGFAIFNGELRFSFVSPRREWSEEALSAYARNYEEAGFIAGAAFHGGLAKVVLDQGVALCVREADPRPGWALGTRASIELIAMQSLLVRHESAGHGPGAADPGL